MYSGIHPSSSPVSSESFPAILLDASELFIVCEGDRVLEEEQLGSWSSLDDVLEAIFPKESDFVEVDVDVELTAVLVDKSSSLDAPLEVSDSVESDLGHVQTVDDDSISFFRSLRMSGFSSEFVLIVLPRPLDSVPTIVDGIPESSSCCIDCDLSVPHFLSQLFKF